MQLKEILPYKDLMWLFVKRDFIANAAFIRDIVVYSKKGMSVLINFPKGELVIEE